MIHYLLTTLLYTHKSLIGKLGFTYHGNNQHCSGISIVRESLHINIVPIILYVLQQYIGNEAKKEDFAVPFFVLSSISES